jgi:hypothetical protein
VIKVLMTDFDGVIRHWNNKKLFLFEKDNALEEGFLFSYALRDEFLNPAMLGEITHEQCNHASKQGHREYQIAKTAKSHHQFQ